MQIKKFIEAYHKGIYTNEWLLELLFSKNPKPFNQKQFLIKAIAATSALGLTVLLLIFNINL